MTRNEKILSMRGKKSFGIIGRELGITRNAVAGVMWRDTWGPSKRKTGRPRRRGKYAEQTMPMGENSHGR